jgi:hypothetical protein
MNEQNGNKIVRRYEKILESLGAFQKPEESSHENGNQESNLEDYEQDPLIKVF